MSRSAYLGFCAIAAVLLVAAPASPQGTSAAAIAGVVTDTSGAILPGVTVEATSPALIEKVRATVTDERGQYRIVELRPGTYTLTFTMEGFAPFKRVGLELTPNFTANVGAELKLGSLAETVTVSGATPLVDINNVARQTVISKTLLDAVPSGKNLLSIYALTPGLVMPAQAQDVGGSKGESTARGSVHGSRQADSKMMLDGMSFNWFESEGSGRQFYVNALAASEIVLDTASGASAQYTSNGVAMNLIPRSGSNQFNGTLFAAGTNHNLQSDNMTDYQKSLGFKTTNGVRTIYDANVVLSGPLIKDKLWFMTAHRRWGRREQIANLFFDSKLDDTFYTPDYDRPAQPAEDFRSDNARVTWQINQKNKLNLSYEWQLDNQQNNFGYFNSGTASMESASLYCNGSYLAEATWTSTATNHLLFEGGMLFLDAHASSFENPCVGRPTGRYIKDTASTFPINGNGPTQSDNGQRPFRQRFSMTYVTGRHQFKAGMYMEESLPRETYSSRGDTPYTIRVTNGVVNQLTEYVSPTYGGEMKIRPDLSLFAQDQWTIGHFTLNLGLRYEYHRVYAAAIDEPAGPLVGARSLAEVDCIPCWHDINPRSGIVWDVFGNGKTALKASFGRYVSLQSYIWSRQFSPQSATVSSTTRSWTDANKDLVPDCNLRDPLSNGECGPMANNAFGGQKITTTLDPALRTGRGKRAYTWASSISIDHQLTGSIGISGGYYHTTYGGFLVTRNTAVDPADFDPYYFVAPVDSRLPADVSGQVITGLYDIRPEKFGQVNNVVTLASNFGKMSEVYNGADVNFSARLRHGIQTSGGWNIGNSLSTLTTWPPQTFSKINQCLVVNSPQDLKWQVGSSPSQGCETGNPYQSQFKMNASFPLPWDLQTAVVYQNLPAPGYEANYTVSKNDIKGLIDRTTGLPRSLSGGASSVTVDIVQPLSQFLDFRIQQVDVRLSKMIQFKGSNKLQLNFDIYNMLNNASTLWVNNTVGPNWLNPQASLDARLFKFSLQYDF